MEKGNLISALKDIFRKVQWAQLKLNTCCASLLDFIWICSMVTKVTKHRTCALSKLIVDNKLIAT